MLELRRYWTMYRLNLSLGMWESSEIAAAKQFLFSPTLTTLGQADEQEIQHRLWTLCRAKELTIRSHAALNLRCYISHAAKRTLDHLVQEIKASDKYTLTQDLYSCVLNDEGKLLQFMLEDDEQRLKFVVDERHRLVVVNGKSRQAVSRPFSFHILATFEPHRSQKLSLANWTSRLVKQEPEVKCMLREYGWHPPQSLWQYLSKIQPQQLRSLEQEYSQFPPETIAYHGELLTILRQVHHQYRRERLKGQSQEQQHNNNNYLWEMMLVKVQQQAMPITSIPALQDELGQIRKFIDNYQKGMHQCQSWEQQVGNTELTLGEITGHHYNGLEELERRRIEEFYYHIEREFMPCYRQQRLLLLDQSLETTILQRLNYLQNSRSRRLAHQSTQYILALRYFYVSGMSMREIAAEIGEQHGYQVSRLLNLKALLDDSKRQMLLLLHQLFADWVKKQAAAEHRQIWEEQPGIAIQLLDESIADIIDIFAQAQVEKYNWQHATKSLVAERICCFVISF
ncbi:MAG: hypothetical protein F6K47_31625 [Symploca sp. SIO2E6]|nr:hypothetical protein [Symploca sp. SIO2E6]